MNRGIKFGVIALALSFLSVLTFGEQSNIDTDLVFKIEHLDSSVFQKALRAEGDEDITTVSPSNPDQPTATNATGLDECLDGNDRGCCYQFTWPGPNFDTGANFSCPAYLKQYNTKEPCIPPVVLTTKPNGMRPNLTELIMHCEANTCKIYCRKSTSCVKYSYFQNTKNGQQLYNETKFCGSVLSDNSGVQIQNGCYKEKLDGYTREVCVCQGHLCNASPVLSQVLSSLFYSAMLAVMCWVVS